MNARRLINFLPVLITGLVLLVLAACQAPAAVPLPTHTSVSPTETPLPPTEPPAAQMEGNSLVGTWVQPDPGGEFFLLLSPDSTFAASHRYNDLEKFPVIKGAYQIDDAVMTINVDTGLGLTCAEKTGKFTITLVGADQFLLQELDWEECRQFGKLSYGTVPWERYSLEQ